MSGTSSGFVFRVDRAKGPVWYAKWREPSGRQVKRRIGPAWTRRGRPTAGFFTKRTAEEWLRTTLASLDELAARGDFGGSALRRRYLQALDRAGVRRLRFHDLRHTFGTRMIAKADIVRVQEWMGHADIQTTRRYLHFRPQHDDAALVAEAFAVEHAAPFVRAPVAEPATTA